MSDAAINGKKKVAILLMILGPDMASRVLKQFPEEDIENVTMEIANLRRVEKETRDEVLDEFILLGKARQYVLDGGVEYARDILEKAVGHHKAVEIIKKLKEQIKIKPFTFVHKADPKQVVNLISREHPQTIALILSYLAPQQSAIILAELPAEMQADIARRIALMERTSPEILKTVEGVLREQMANVFQHDFTQAGGVEAVVNILNRIDRGSEKLILDKLEREDAELAELIRQRMFVFEDIITLDDASIQRVVREIDSKDLAKALKGASDDVKGRILKNISKRAGEMLNEELEYMGPVRLREVEEAQRKIVHVIRRLDEAGEIIIARGGEDTIVV